MKRIMQIYFLLYVLAGGFRHVIFEVQFFNFLQERDNPLWLVLIMIVLQLIALAYVFFENPLFLLLFYVLTLVSDIFVQNFIKFESSVILVHQLPLLAFLYLYCNKSVRSEATLRYALLLLIAIGFVSSGFAKLTNGWFNWSTLTLKNHLQTLQYSYEIPVFFDLKHLSFLPDVVWKIADVVVVFFQLSFVTFFFSFRLLKERFLGLVLFHWIISLVMGIHVFYPYLLVYFAVFIDWKDMQPKRVTDWLMKIIASVFLILFLIHPTDTDFVMKQLPIWFYRNYDFILTGIIGAALTIQVVGVKDTLKFHNT